MSAKEQVRDLEFMTDFRFDIYIKDEDDTTVINNDFLLELLDYISELQDDIIELDDSVLDISDEKESIENELEIAEGTIAELEAQI